MIPFFAGFVLGAASLIFGFAAWGYIALPREWPPAITVEEIAEMRRERTERAAKREARR